MFLTAPLPSNPTYPDFRWELVSPSFFLCSEKRPNWSLRLRSFFQSVGFMDFFLHLKVKVFFGMNQLEHILWEYLNQEQIVLPFSKSLLPNFWLNYKFSTTVQFCEPCDLFFWTTKFVRLNLGTNFFFLGLSRGNNKLIPSVLSVTHLLPIPCKLLV